MNPNLQRLQVISDQLDLQERDFMEYAHHTKYAIMHISPSGRIKWCNDNFLDLLNLNKDYVIGKGVKRILGTTIDLDTDNIVLEVQDEECKFEIEHSELSRKGKLIHRKIILIPA